MKKHGIFAEEESQVVTSRYDDDASEEKVDVSGSSNGEEFLKSMDKNIKDVSSNNQEVFYFLYYKRLHSILVSQMLKCSKSSEQ